MLDHAAGERGEPERAAPDGNVSAAQAKAQADAQAERAEQVRFAAALRETLARHHVNIPIPTPGDHVYFMRGMPVAPWIPLRDADLVWSAWLERLHTLWEGWTQLSETAVADWQSWRGEHVHLLHAHHTRVGMESLIRLLDERQVADSGVHLVGHSVGGAAALAYLAALRASVADPSLARLRSVITLDAAVFGIAGVWTGTRKTLGAGAAQAFKGLGAWAAEHGIGVLTACNERDVWSHRAIADLPYVGIRLGPRLGTLAHINGSIHGLLRRRPELVEAIWTPAGNLPAPGAEPLPPASHLSLAE